MAQPLGRIGLFVLLTVLAPGAFAQNGTVQGNEEVLSNEFILLPPDLFAPGGDDDGGRTDVREATLPPPPSGPATPVPFCGPGDPICP
jgi:hypothetical protein